MQKASCHCGKVRIEIGTLPATVTDCNCSLCRRYGALWGYYRRDQGIPGLTRGLNPWPEPAA